MGRKKMYEEDRIHRGIAPPAHIDEKFVAKCKLSNMSYNQRIIYLMTLDVEANVFEIVKKPEQKPLDQPIQINTNPETEQISWLESNASWITQTQYRGLYGMISELSNKRGKPISKEVLENFIKKHNMY